MAMTADSTPTDVTAPPQPVTVRPLQTRNPLPLSAAQEQQVQEIYYKRVRAICRQEIQDFAACALNRTVSAAWACRDQRTAMNACLVHHSTQEQRDLAREEWFATRDDRRREREKVLEKRAQVLAFRREYYGVDEEGRRLQKKTASEGKS